MTEKQMTDGILSSDVREEINAWLSKYPNDQKRSAVLAALRAVQHESKWISREQMDAVAAYLDLPVMAVYEVASFYSIFNLEPVGKHVISVCTNISCMLRGGEEVLGYLEKKLGIHVGESTTDGLFYLKKEEECLAACGGAPMMQVDHVYYENLTPEKIDSILSSLE